MNREKGATMTPPVAMLKDTTVLDACEEAGGVLRVSAPGYGTYDLVRCDPALQEEPLSESDIASLKSGIADLESGRYMSMDDFLAEIRAEYGL